MLICLTFFKYLNHFSIVLNAAQSVYGWSVYQQIDIAKFIKNMSITYETTPLLADQLNKCRCCLRTFSDDQEFVKITKGIENIYSDLTQIRVRNSREFEFSIKVNYSKSFQLIKSDELSSKICQVCNNDLDVFSQFRSDLKVKQYWLYQALEQEHPEYASLVSNVTKLEVNQFIECPIDLSWESSENLAQKCDDMFQSAVIKTEDYENIEELEEEYLDLETSVDETNTL